MTNSGDKVSGFRYLDLSAGDVMEAFDSLPCELRAAYANAASNLSPIPACKAIQNGMPVQRVLSLISAADHKFIANAYADRGVSQ